MSGFAGRLGPPRGPDEPPRRPGHAGRHPHDRSGRDRDMVGTCCSGRGHVDGRSDDAKRSVCWDRHDAAATLLGSWAMSAVDDAAEAALTAALGLNDRGDPPVNQVAIAAAISAVAIVAGLGLVLQIPRPSTIGAGRSYIDADAASRQRISISYSRRVNRVARDRL